MSRRWVLVLASTLPPVAAIAAAVPRWIALSEDDRGAAALGIPPLLGAAILVGFSVASAIAILSVALFLASRSSAVPFVSIVGLTLFYGVSRILITPVLTADFEPPWLGAVVLAIQGVLVMNVWYRFPDGRYVPRLGVIAVALAVLLETTRVAASVARRSDELSAPIRVVELSFFASGVIAQMYRFRRASTPTQRQQMKWFIVGGLIILASLSVALVQVVVPEAGIPGTAASYAFLLLYTSVLSVGAAAASLAIAFGVLKYRLFDVDVVINRGALYATAAILLLAMFGLIGSALEQALGPALHQQTDVLRALTAIALAPAFAPLQRRLRPLIDQLLPANEPLALMFADIVGSTEVAVALGDERWRQMLASYYTTVRRELRAHSGTEVDTAGDGVFATFLSPTEALRCALALLPAVRRSGLRTRIGLHYGLCDVRGEKPSGRNVIIAARIMAAAEADTILMSSDQRDAIASPDLVVESVGDRSLKGIPAPIALYRAML